MRTVITTLLLLLPFNAFAQSEASSSTTPAPDTREWQQMLRDMNAKNSQAQMRAQSGPAPVPAKPVAAADPLRYTPQRMRPVDAQGRFADDPSRAVENEEVILRKRLDMLNRLATQYGFNVTQGPGSELRRAWIQHQLDQLQANERRSYSIQIAK